MNYIKPKEIESQLPYIHCKNQLISTTKASLFNLIIYTKKNKREEYIKQILKNIIRYYPCRIILITVCESGDFLNTSVNILTPEKNGKNTIFCDIINFEVSISFIERIPFVIIPHLLSDRPVYLLWADDPSEDNLISMKLKNLSTRTVFDSETAIHITDFSNTLIRLHDTLACSIGDLSWARIAPWRALFVHYFNTEDKIDCINKTKQINIVYNNFRADQCLHKKIQSLYFQGYLSVKLGWKFNSVIGIKEDLLFKYHSDYGPIDIALTVGKNTNLQSGRLIKIELVSYDNQHISFERDFEHIDKVKIQLSTSSHCEMPIHHILESEDIGKSMSYEIYNQGTSETFLKVLKLLSLYPNEIICSCV